MFTVVEFQANDSENIWNIVKAHDTSFFIKGSAMEIVNWMNDKCYNCKSSSDNQMYSDDKSMYLVFVLNNNEKRRQLWAEITESGMAAVRVVRSLDDLVKKMDIKCTKCNNIKQVSNEGSYTKNVVDNETKATDIDVKPQLTGLISYRDFSQEQMLTSTPMPSTSHSRIESSLPLQDLSSLTNQSSMTEDGNSTIASNQSLTLKAEPRDPSAPKSCRKSFNKYNITKASLTCKKCSKVVRCRNPDGKDYKIKACMLSHLKMHTPTVPFQCNLCDYAARYQNVMRAHMEKHHENESINYTNMSNSVQYTEETNALADECFPKWDLSN